MEKKIIKALFFDIDGTLVPFGDHGVPAEVKEAVSELRRRGVKVFISTGRHLEWIDNLGDLETDGYVTVNGAMCVLADKKSVIFSRPIPSADLERLIDFGKTSDLCFVVVPEEGGIFINREDHYVSESSKLLNLPPIPIKHLSSARGKKIVQMMAFGSQEERVAGGLFTEILTDCEPTSWNPLFCDIIPKGSNKSVGMAKMLEHFGIAPEESMAFGDGDNDIAMLRFAGIGVAMGNSADSVKEAADYVTSDVRDHGVLNAFRRFGLL